MDLWEHCSLQFSISEKKADHLFGKNLKSLRVRESRSNSFVKNGQQNYEIGLRDNVNYFPVIQSAEPGFEAHLIA